MLANMLSGEIVQWDIFVISDVINKLLFSFFYYICEVPGLLAYFPDIDHGKLLERSFVMSILSTLKTEEMRELIKAARNNRSIASNPDEEEMIEMTDHAKEEI